MPRLSIVLFLVLVCAASGGVVSYRHFAAQEMQQGFIDKTYTAPDGSQHKYCVFVPFAPAADDHPPLILYLNGFGKNGNDGLLPLRDGLAPVIWETKATFPCVVVFPQCNEGSSWMGNSPDAQRALAIMEQTAQEYHTDSDRMYLTGLSSGGNGVWSIASAHPEEFAAIAPMSATGVSESDIDSIADANLPVWAFYVKDDVQVPEDQREFVHRQLVNAGMSPRYTVVEGTAHSSWDAAYRMPAFYTWLLNQSRDKNKEPGTKFRPLIAGMSLHGWSPQGNGNWTCEAEGILSGVGESGSESGEVMTNEAFGDFEFHVDFKMGETRKCSLSLQSTEGESSNEWTFVALAPELGSGGLYDEANHKWLAPTDLIAQRALRMDGWNDCRIRLSDHRIVIELNGLKAIDYQASECPSPATIAFASPAQPGAQVHWRNPRIRTVGK